MSLFSHAARSSKSAKSKSVSSAASVVPELLESRQLMSATWSLSPAGVLTFTGSAKADDLYISIAPGNKLNVSERVGSSYVLKQSYNRTAVKSVVANMGDGDDQFYIDGNLGNLPSVMTGGKGADRLTGGDGKDIIRGEAGNDILNGGRNDDTIDGGLGYDQIIGGFGVDTADYSSRTENLIITLDGNFNDGAPGEQDLVANDIENVIGGAGNDTITGNALANKLDGGKGNDTIKGGAGDDTLIGGLGIDKLYGEAGNDTLYGRSTPSDKDTLDGGLGTDKAQKDVLDSLFSVESIIA